MRMSKSAVRSQLQFTRTKFVVSSRFYSGESIVNMLSFQKFLKPNFMLVATFQYASRKTNLRRATVLARNLNNAVREIQRDVRTRIG